MRQVRAERLVPITLAPEQPDATLLVRDLPPTARRRTLPWIVAPDADAAPRSPPDVLSVYPSEVLAALQHLQDGRRDRPALAAARARTADGAAAAARPSPRAPSCAASGATTPASKARC